MRVAALYDIHGNVHALRAVLEDVKDSGADTIVLGGDIVAGPFPIETLELLRSLEGVISIRGNADREVAGVGERTLPGNEVWAKRTRWVRERLSEANLHLLGSLPERATLDIEGLGPTLFCHATPRSDEEIVTSMTPEDVALETLQDVEQRLVICGHTHMQFDRLVGEYRLVNAGSVGLPYEGEPAAFWALLGPEVKLRKTLYDVEAAAEAVRRSDWPGAEDFARKQLLDPLTRQEATAFMQQMAEARARATRA